MKPSKYKIFFFFFFSVKVFSQNFLGASSGNYSGTNALPLNPANVVDSRYKVFLHAGGVGLDIQNNYAEWKAPFSFPQMITWMITKNVDPQYQAPSGKLQWLNTYTAINQNKQNIRLFFNVEGRGPAIQFGNLKNKTGIAAGVRYRLLTSLTHASSAIAEAVVLGLKLPTDPLVPSTDNKFSMNNGLYNEYFVTFGKIIIDEDDKFIKLGVTGKRLVSNSATNLTGHDVDFKLVRYPPDPTKRIIELPNTDASFSVASKEGMPFSDFVNINGLGKGFGLDIGLIYEFRPHSRKYEFSHQGKWMSDATKNKYKYKIGVSLVDIGYLKFKDPEKVSTSKIVSSNNEILPNDFFRLKLPQDLANSIENVYNLNPLTYGHSYTALYPATAILSFDYAYTDKVYINTIWRQSLLRTFRRGIVGYSGISIIPRYERKYFEFSAPISLDNNYSNLNIGLAVRAGGLYLGSDNALGIFNVGNPRGISVYAGLFLPIYARLPKSPLKCYYDENYKIKGYRKKKLSFFRKV